MIYYIADMHFGHTNVLRFDNRPFPDTAQMDDIGFCTRWNGLSALSSVTEISWKKRTLYGRISHRRI